MSLRELGLSQQSKVFAFVRDYSMDATIALINLKNVFSNVDHAFVKYSVIDFRLDDLKLNEYDFVFFLGLAPSYKDTIEKKKNYILLLNQENYRYIADRDKNFYVKSDTSVSILTNRFVQSFFQIQLDNMKNINDMSYDFVFQRWSESSVCVSLNWIHSSLSREKFLERFKDGNVHLSHKEKEFVSKKKEEFISLYKSLDIKKISDHSCYVESSDFLEEICFAILKGGQYKVVFCNTKKARVCMRTHDPRFNLANMVSQYPESGGLAKAASFPFNTEEEFVDRIQLLSKLIDSEMKK